MLHLQPDLTEQLPGSRTNNSADNMLPMCQTCKHADAALKLCVTQHQTSQAPELPHLRGGDGVLAAVGGRTVRLSQAAPCRERLCAQDCPVKCFRRGFGASWGGAEGPMAAQRQLVCRQQPVDVLCEGVDEPQARTAKEGPCTEAAHCRLELTPQCV